VRKRVREIATTLPNIARQVASQSPELEGNQIVDRLLEIIDRRAALTLDRLPANA